MLCVGLWCVGCLAYIINDVDKRQRRWWLYIYERWCGSHVNLAKRWASEWILLVARWWSQKECVLCVSECFGLVICVFNKHAEWGGRYVHVLCRIAQTPNKRRSTPAIWCDNAKRFLVGDSLFLWVEDFVCCDCNISRAKHAHFGLNECGYIIECIYVLARKVCGLLDSDRLYGLHDLSQRWKKNRPDHEPDNPTKVWEGILSPRQVVCVRMVTKWWSVFCEFLFRRLFGIESESDHALAAQSGCAVCLFIHMLFLNIVNTAWVQTRVECLSCWNCYFQWNRTRWNV